MLLAVASLGALSPSQLDELALEHCHGRVFLDGGSNTGDSVRSFLSGGFFGCALNGPHRLYNSRWPSLGARERRAQMAPLREPSTFCVRSFEANPQLVPLLRAGAALPGEPESGGLAPNVRYIDGALSNRSGTDVPRTVVTYARNRWGSTATTLAFKDIHPSQPPLLLSAIVRGASYDVRDVLRNVVAHNASSLIGLKLDVEGDEFWMLDQLSREPQLLCNISYLFVEFHNLPGMRANLSQYGLNADMYEVLKRQIHPLMEQPSCRLKVYWRSFWSACGDVMRFQWRDTEQASDKPPKPKGNKKRRGRRLIKGRGKGAKVRRSKARI